MSGEEKKAIASLNEILFENAKEITLYELGINDLKIILNLIENQQQELQLKDKVIDEMAEMLVKVPDNADNPTTAVAIAMINRNLEIKKRQVIQYVINKVKGE